MGPGVTDTRMNAAMLADQGKVAWLLDQIPSRRIADPVDMVGTAVYCRLTRLST